MLISPFHPNLPKQHDNELHFASLPAASASLAISALASDHDRPILLLTEDVRSANRFIRELEFFRQDKTLPIYHFPDWETLPYDYFSPHQDLISERLSTLYRLPKLKRGIIIAALPTVMHRLLPQYYLESNAFVLSVGEKLDLTNTREQLITAGYSAVHQVMEHGEFALRGAIMDIYPMGSKLPYRIELFDDVVESIRSFNPENQLSIEKIQHIDLLPAREYPLTEMGTTHFRQAWRQQFSGNPKEAPIYQNISQATPTAGVEYYLPLFYEKLNTFFDYLPENTQLVLSGNTSETGNAFWQEINERYEQLRYDVTRPICQPNDVFLTIEQFYSQIKPFNRIKLHQDTLKEKQGHINFSAKVAPSLTIHAKSKKPFQALEAFINDYSGRVLFCAESSGRKEILLEQLNEIKIRPKFYPAWSDFLSDQERIGITVARLDQGLLLDDPKIILISEPQLFGDQVMQRRLREKTKIDPDQMFRNLTELSISAPVVHIEHGVGRYLGLETISTNNIEAEYLTLEYAGGDKIYVPVSSLNLISRYTGINSEQIPLQKLGSQKWAQAKKKTTDQIRDVAAELLDIYSRRLATPGYAFPAPGQPQQQFRRAFAFEETPDQTLAIDDVLADMIKPNSMDRLICGDVGFGKTEVAMQATFLAISAGKQVAILVPTTLLASQHLQTFQDRFANWPIHIAAISRLRSQSEQKAIIKKLKEGKIDIIIGTHKLLQSDIKFKDLGLLIVDEEHRFGVRQKEKIKSLRAHVDILTLTATPIPRTLNMALAKTRDLSIIATPPARRLSIKTFIHEYNPALIREAIMREAMRGGQVYFLHNEVATIEATAEKLLTMIPEARIAIAHGQMGERQLESIMSDFYHQKYNVLVCTTIIESGIDIPTANTIIINQANRFGLAQLHQIRGRVGRSHHQAYAYLLIPDKKALTADAKKRLQTIAELEELGAGFNLATHDLEIRGAGELLGDEQSGHIQAVGFSLYMELLEEAVIALKSGREPTFEPALQSGPEIDLKISALIPEAYVPDVHTRLSLYKRLSYCKKQSEIQNLKAELIDRFGLLPKVTQNLFNITTLKLQAAVLGIKKITTTTEYGYLHFNEKPNINPETIIRLIQKEPRRYQLQGADKIKFTFNSDHSKERIKEIEALLKSFA